jgi:ketosteroid isomerase-like protein
MGTQTCTLTDREVYLGSDQVLTDLREINARFIHNFVTNDVQAHDALLHEEFMTIQSDGATLDRATYLHQWAVGFDPEVIPHWDTRDEQITVVGDCALVRSTNYFVVVGEDGEQQERMSRYTDTYLYTAEGWRCIQAQITPLLPEHLTGADTVVSTYLRGVKQDSPSGRHP